MSTEQQNYPFTNGALAIDDYASRHGLSIIETYADYGKSGLRREAATAFTA